ncbi:hypothetical protein ACPOL_0379 [Acidisarcina polymorpha]|uniref:Uncharacterized protein n=1 Tax=Acidisarcina polymorpha TaxID=2211140 RepID=A0A2Z5FSG4_9BACT|nr:hypothetical protein [Acidisarcina polymorpha]AXC09760.1 hypothetical protein ACPOL_0379 [Acidisarcina polymorpha]
MNRVGSVAMLSRRFTVTGALTGALFPPNALFAKEQKHVERAIYPGSAK